MAVNDTAQLAYNHQDEIDEALQAGETLQSIEGRLGASIIDGGVNEAEARGLVHAVEHFCSRLGADGTKVFPAVEEFKDPKKRVVATKVAMEGLRDMISRIWASIVEAFKKVVEWAKEFARFVQDAFDDSYRKADDMMRRAKMMNKRSIPHDRVVAQKGDSSDWLLVLAKDGKVAEGNHFVSDIGDFVTAAAGFQKDELQLAVDGRKMLAEALLAPDREDQMDALSGAMRKFGDIAPGTPIKNSDYAGEGLEVREAPLMFGNRSYFSVIFDGSRSLKEMDQTQFKRFVAASTGKAKVDAVVADVEPLTPDNVIYVCDAVKRYAKVKHAGAGASAELMAAMKAVEHVGTKTRFNQGAGANDGTGGKEAENARAIAKLANTYMKAVTQGARALRSYDLSVMRSTLTYCAHSLKMAI